MPGPTVFSRITRRRILRVEARAIRKRAPASEKPEDGALVASYGRTGNIWSTGKEFNVSGQWVHGRLRKLGISTSKNYFSNEDDERLRSEYLEHVELGKLADLAKSMGRTKAYLCRRARALGLTDQRRPKVFARKWKGMPEADARVLMDDFKASSLQLGRYCKYKGYSEVGFWQTMTGFFPDEWEHVIEAKAPATTMYRLGRAFEYRTRDALRKAGFFVLRAPASRSPLDLLAVRRGVCLFVQCKTGGSLPPKEWNELFDLAVSVGAVPILAWRSGLRSLSFATIDDRKDGSKRKQPMTEVSMDDLVGWGGHAQRAAP